MSGGERPPQLVRARTPLQRVDSDETPPAVVKAGRRHTALASGDAISTGHSIAGVAAARANSSARMPIFGLPDTDAMGRWERYEVEYLYPILRQGESTKEGIDGRVCSLDADDIRDRLHLLRQQHSKHHDSASPAIKSALSRLGERLTSLLDAVSDVQLSELVKQDRIRQFVDLKLNQHVSDDRHLDPSEHQRAWVDAAKWGLGEVEFGLAIELLRKRYHPEQIRIDPRKGLGIRGLNKSSHASIESLREQIVMDESSAFSGVREMLRQKAWSNELNRLAEDKSICPSDDESQHFERLARNIGVVEQHPDAPLAPWSLLFALGHRSVRIGAHTVDALSDIAREVTITTRDLAPLLTSGLLALWCRDVLAQPRIADELIAQDGRTPHEKATRFLFRLGRTEIRVPGCGTFSSARDLARSALLSEGAFTALAGAFATTTLPDYIDATYERAADVWGPAGRPEKREASKPLAYRLLRSAGADQAPIFLDATSPAQAWSAELGIRLLGERNYEPLKSALVSGVAEVYFGRAASPYWAPAAAAAQFFALSGDRRIVFPADHGVEPIALSVGPEFLEAALTRPNQLMSLMEEGVIREWARVHEPTWLDALDDQVDLTLRVHLVLWSLGFQGIITGTSGPSRQCIVHAHPRVLVGGSVARDEVLALVRHGVLMAWLKLFDKAASSSLAYQIDNAHSGRGNTDLSWVADRTLEALGAAAPDLTVYSVDQLSVGPGSRRHASIFVAHRGASSSAHVRVTITSDESDHNQFIVMLEGGSVQGNGLVATLNPGETIEFRLHASLPIGATSTGGSVVVHVQDVDRAESVWKTAVTLHRNTEWLPIIGHFAGGCAIGTSIFYGLASVRPGALSLAIFGYFLLVLRLMVATHRVRGSRQLESLVRARWFALLVGSCVAIGTLRHVLDSVMQSVMSLALAINPSDPVHGFAFIGMLTGFIAGSSRASRRYFSGVFGLFVTASSILACLITVYALV